MHCFQQPLIKTNRIFSLNKQRTNRHSSLSNLKSELQKATTSISNMVIAIEKGIITETPKARLEELKTKNKHYKKTF